MLNGDDFMNDVTNLYQAILSGDSRGAESSARRALAAEVDPMHLFSAAVIPAMHEARRRFQAHEDYVPEMLIACRAMKAAMHEIRPRLAANGFEPAARVRVISLTYQDEDLTSGLVSDLLEAEGFDVTRSSLVVPEVERAEQWRIAGAAVVVLVMPTISLIRGSACIRSPVCDTVERLRRDRMDYGGKVLLVGGGSSHADVLGLDAHVDDFADVVPVVERLIPKAGQV
jgi:hypothetical protein